MRIAVTGVAGFLGSNLLDRLLDEGHAVVGVDNLAMGRQRNISHRLEHPGFEFIEGDVTRAEVMDRLPGDVDLVVHLAAFKIPRYGNAIDTLTINYEGTRRALDYARRTGAKCVLASTSDVYGRNPAVPFSEAGSDSVIGSSKSARWSYAVSKLFDEHLAFAYQEAYGFPVTLLRFFGSYGPRQHLSWWGGPQSVFIDQILAGEPVTIHGDGSQTRTFTYVDDTIECMYRSIVDEAADGEVFNIGSNAEISILELARLIGRLIDDTREVAIEFVPYASFTGKPYEDVMRRVPDTTFAAEQLGFVAQVPLEEGLRRTIAWQREVAR
jgi:UDP-glucose 4-epimerase